MANLFDFSSGMPEPVPFTAPDGSKWELREPSSTAMDLYDNKRLEGAKIVEQVDGKNKVEFPMGNKAGLDRLLVQICSWNLAEGRWAQPADISGEKPWTPKMIQALSPHAKRLAAIETGDKVREQFGSLLADKIEAMRSDVKGMDEYRELAVWLEPTEEEKAKNALSDTETGSI